MQAFVCLRSCTVIDNHTFQNILSGKLHNPVAQDKENINTATDHPGIEQKGKGNTFFLYLHRVNKTFPFFTGFVSHLMCFASDRKKQGTICMSQIFDSSHTALKDLSLTSLKL